MNLFGIGQAGKSSNVTAQERQNCYIEVQPGDDRSTVAIYGTPGLSLFTSFGDTPIRGIHPRGDFIYIVHRGTFYEINNAGVKTARGTIGTTSGKVYMSNNGTQLMLTDGTLGYIYNFNTLVFAQITDVDYPGAVTTTWMDGYFIINPPNGQRFYISAINDGLSWNALDFASAESNPDNLVAVVTDNSNLYLFGDVSTEFWSNTGAQDFPYARISGGATEWGCASRDSIVKFDNALVFLAKNRMGQVIVAKMNGYTPMKLSTAELDYIINNYPTVGDASSFSYLIGGHPMLQINFPSAGESWLYDGLSNCWSKLKSYGITRHRAEMGCNYLNRTIVTDYSSGNLYTLDPDQYTDNGDPIEFELISRHISADDNRIIIDALQLDIESGVGLVSGQGSNPQIMMSVSKDGGHEYGVEQWVAFGAMGMYKYRAIWRMLGQSRDWCFKFRITDPVKKVIFGSVIKSRVCNS